MRPDYYVLDKETCPHMSLRLHTMSCIVVSIFKILETLAKNNLEHHLRKMNVTGYSSIMWVKFNGILIHPNFNYDSKHSQFCFLEEINFGLDDLTELMVHGLFIDMCIIIIY